MGRSAAIIGAALLVSIAGSWSGIVYAKNYVKVADEWGTIQPGGARSSPNGNRFWNIEGGANGDFASAGTLRFYTEDLVAQLDADFPGGWQIDGLTMVLEHEDSGFSRPGGISVFHFTNDALAITNGAVAGTGDANPGDFDPLELSPLVYDDTGMAGGQPVRVFDFLAGSAPDMGTVTRVNDYMSTTDGAVATDDGRLDVLGTAGSVVEPAGAENGTTNYNYGLLFPNLTAGDAVQEDTLASFNTRLAANSGEWQAGAVATLAADIEDGTDALSFIFAATEDNNIATGTYKGGPFLPFLTGDYNGDRVVNAADYTVWRDTLGSTTDLRANGDNSGTSENVIDEADYAIWVDRFGNVGASAFFPPRLYIEASATLSLGGQVPEPASFTLVAIGLAGPIGLAGLLGRRRVR
jgi:hypothetical protein